MTTTATPLLGAPSNVFELEAVDWRTSRKMCYGCRAYCESNSPWAVGVR